MKDLLYGLSTCFNFTGMAWSCLMTHSKDSLLRVGYITILPDFGTFDDHTTKYVDSQLKSQPANVNYLILPRHRGKSLESPALQGFSEYFCRLPWRPSPGDLQWLINIPEIKRNLSGDIENRPCKEVFGDFCIQMKIVI